MFKIALAGWVIDFSRTDTEITVNVNNVDGSPVMDTEADIGGDNELGYRLTSEKIEADYQSSGDVKASTVEQKLWVGDVEVTMVNDADNHLNLYFSHVGGSDVEHDSLTNGTMTSPSCEIGVYI